MCVQPQEGDTGGGGEGGTGGQRVLVVFSTNIPREKQGDGGG